jgi:uncharacterized protein YgbK (DUF1537 family)
VEQIVDWNPSITSPGNADVLTINGDTRRMRRNDAAKTIASVLATYGSQPAYAKRIDTTLRGHLKTETDILLQHIPESIALVVPAYPASGRTTIGGYHLLNGRLLERTELAHDPLWPVRSSYAPGFFGPETERIPIDIISQGAEAVANALRTASSRSRVIVADALTDNDIDILASGAMKSGLRILPVDPGPFTSAYAGRLLLAKSNPTILAVIGSTSELTERQLASLAKNANVRVMYLRTDRLLLAATRKIVWDIPADFSGGILVLRPGEKLERGSEETVAAGLAEAGAFFMDTLTPRVSGVILSGGDTAIHFARRMGISVLSPEAEIQPLMMGGRVVNEPCAGLLVVTKGGLIGREDALERAAEWIFREKRRES